MSVQVLVPWRDPGCAHRRAAWAWCQKRWRALHPSWPLVVGTCGEGPWNPARALNDCLDKADADVVLLMGADTVVMPEVANAAVEAAKTNPWVLVTNDMLRLPPGFTRRLLCQSPSMEFQPPPESERLWNPFGWGPLAGRLDMLRAVGWDERFMGYGGEDDSFSIAARLLLGEPWRGTASASLLWHPAPTRDPNEFGRNLDLLDRYGQAWDEPALLAGVLDVERCSFTAPQGACCLPHTHKNAHLVRERMRV